MQHKKVSIDGMGIVGLPPVAPPEDSDGSYSPRYSDKLSPSIHGYFTEASRPDHRVSVASNTEVLQFLKCNLVICLVFSRRKLCSRLYFVKFSQMVT
jgi:hypothetical protein